MKGLFCWGSRAQTSFDFEPVGSRAPPAWVDTQNEKLDEKLDEKAVASLRVEPDTKLDAKPNPSLDAKPDAKPSAKILTGKPVAKTGTTASYPSSHYALIQHFLAPITLPEPSEARSRAREKLTRLTRLQMQELTTDVYDETIRRMSQFEEDPVQYLPAQDEFHPKRNQAREKLSTLPKSRFATLASDVFYELGRRHPELKESQTIEGDVPPAY